MCEFETATDAPITYAELEVLIRLIIEDFTLLKAAEIKKELHPLGTRFYPWYHPDSCSILLAAGTYLLRNVQVTFSLTYRLSPFQRNSLHGKFNPYLNRRRLPACDLLSLSENNSLLTRSLLFPKID